MAAQAARHDQQLADQAAEPRPGRRRRRRPGRRFGEPPLPVGRRTAITGRLPRASDGRQAAEQPARHAVAGRQQRDRDGRPGDHQRRQRDQASSGRASGRTAGAGCRRAPGSRPARAGRPRPPAPSRRTAAWRRRRTARPAAANRTRSTVCHWLVEAGSGPGQAGGDRGVLRSPAPSRIFGIAWPGRAGERVQRGSPASGPRPPSGPFAVGTNQDTCSLAPW